MDTPQHKNPCHRGHEIYNFGITFLGHHYYTLVLVCVDHAQEKRRLFLKNYINYTLFIPKLPTLRGGGS